MIYPTDLADCVEDVIKLLLGCVSRYLRGFSSYGHGDGAMGGRFHIGFGLHLVCYSLIINQIASSSCWAIKFTFSTAFGSAIYSIYTLC